MDRQAFDQIWEPLRQVVVSHRDRVDSLSVVPVLTPEEIRRELCAFDFLEPVEASALVASVSDLLSKGMVHTTHRGYFGLFNPDVHPIAVAADAIVAAFNPQLAAYSHAPAATEIERHTLRLFLDRLGWEQGFGSFTSGGSEANHSAVVCALADKIPGFAENGFQRSAPTLYVSAEAHHSFVKIAQSCGLGRQSVRQVPVGTDLRMDTAALEALLDRDPHPFMVVATAGTTSAGAIDPLNEIANVCDKRNLWLHVDAAWGGAAVLSPRLGELLSGIERADSLTLDAHKWLSVPMGAGMTLLRNGALAGKAFGIETAYMPANEGCPDPYTTSMQWSRRFIGLKVFMTLAERGLDEVAKDVDRQSALADAIADGVVQIGGEVVYRSRLGVVTFRLPGLDAENVVKSAQHAGFWISKTVLSHYGACIRACVTNYRTDESDVARLIGHLSALMNPTELK